MPWVSQIRSHHKFWIWIRQEQEIFTSPNTNWTDSGIRSGSYSVGTQFNFRGYRGRFMIRHSPPSNVEMKWSCKTFLPTCLHSVDKDKFTLLWQANYIYFYVHVTVNRNKFIFNKTNRRTNFPNLFLSRNSTCFGQLLCPSSGVFHCTFGTGIWPPGFITNTSPACTGQNSWWWAEELPETCGVSWQK
jgi:hypothetical protein